MKLTATHGIIAMKGSGKTWRAMAHAESMLDAGGQIVAIDPTGAWWGLRFGPDARTVIYPQLLVLGANGSLPLTDTMGEAVAHLVVERGISAVLDLSDMSKAGQRRFVAAFLLELYRKQRRGQLHTFVDEADLFAPERAMGDAALCMGAMSDYFRRGRRKGLGGTIITQRVQAVAKDVLWQCEAMTILRLKGTHDIKAIKEWLDSNGYDAKAVAERLPKLKKGDRYYCGEEHAEFIACGTDVRKTFDSGKTPEADEEAAQPPELDESDLEAIRAQLGHAAEELKANDPKALRAEIARLKKELAVAGCADPVERVVHVEVSKAVVPEGLAKRIDGALGLLTAAREIITDAESKPPVLAPSGPAPSAAVEARRHRRAPLYRVPRSEDEPKIAPAPRENPIPGDVDLPKGELAVLTAVAQHTIVSRRQLTVLTGYKRSSRDAYIQRLAGKGFVAVNGGDVAITDPGFAALGNFTPLPTGDDLLAYWRERLPEGERRVLEAVCQRYPAPVERDWISKQTEYKRSSRDAYLQRLGARGLVEVSREGVKASDQLFDELI